MLSRKLNPFWTIEYADAAMLAEAELILSELAKETYKAMKEWPLNEIELEYSYYHVYEEWPES